MTQASNNAASRRFPSGLGGNTAWHLSDGRKLTLFVIDQTVPLYNIVFGGLRFFANTEQVLAFVEQLDADAGAIPPKPTWQWVFESGFEHSVDGSRNKRWCLHER